MMQCLCFFRGTPLPKEARRKMAASPCWKLRRSLLAIMVLVAACSFSTSFAAKVRRVCDGGAYCAVLRSNCTLRLYQFSFGPGIIEESDADSLGAGATVRKSDGSFVGNCVTFFLNGESDLVWSGCSDGQSYSWKCYDAGPRAGRDSCDCPPGYSPGDAD